MKRRQKNALQNLTRPDFLLENRVHAAKMDGGRFELLNAASDAGADLYLYGDIGPWDITSSMVASALANVTAKTIRVHVNSKGGEIFDGVAIHNLFAAHPAHIEMRVDSLAASIASVICMAGDEITIAKNAMMMIHRAGSIGFGDADDMRALADILEKAESDVLIPCYTDRTGKSAEEIMTMMKAETWMNAQECVDMGFADKVDSPSGVKALVAPGFFAKMPSELVNAGGDWACAADMALDIDETDSWDGPKAAEAILDHAGFNGASPDSEKARPYFFAYDKSAPSKKESYKLPFADFVGGKVKAIEGGLRAVASRLPGTDIPDDLKTDIRSRLDKYFKRRDDEKSARACDEARIETMRNRLRLAQVSV